MDQEISLLLDVVHQSLLVTKQNKEDPLPETSDLSLEEELELLDKQNQKLVLEVNKLEKDLEQHGHLQLTQEKSISNLEKEFMKTKWI